GRGEPEFHPRDGADLSRPLHDFGELLLPSFVTARALPGSQRLQRIEAHDRDVLAPIRTANHAGTLIAGYAPAVLLKGGQQALVVLLPTWLHPSLEDQGHRAGLTRARRIHGCPRHHFLLLFAFPRLPGLGTFLFNLV